MKENLTITISRAYGIPGRNIGKKLADDLGIAYYDNESMADMMPQDEAEYYRTSGETTGADKRYASKLFTQFYQEGGAVEVLSRNMQMFRIQSDLMLRLAEQGSAVFVGRCADKVLEGCPNLVKVFIGASKEWRIHHMAHEESHSAEYVKNKLEEVDKARDTYYRFFADRPWGDRENYDLCLNAEKQTEEGILATIKAYIEGLD